jgi:hypothetical protein
MRLACIGFLAVLSVFAASGARAQDERQVVALLVATVDVYDNPTAAPSRRVPRAQIAVPLSVVEERAEGFVKVKARDGAVFWLDSSQVRLSGSSIRCAAPVARGMPPLGTLGAGDSCRR